MHVPLAQQRIRAGGGTVVFQAGGNLVLVLAGEFFLNVFAVCGICLIGGQFRLQEFQAELQRLILFLQLLARLGLPGTKRGNQEKQESYTYNKLSPRLLESDAEGHAHGGG